MSPASLWLAVLSDLAVNLSAGSLGALVVVPAFSKERRGGFWILTINLLFSIVFLIIAFELRRLSV